MCDQSWMKPFVAAEGAWINVTSASLYKTKSLKMKSLTVYS